MAGNRLAGTRECGWSLTMAATFQKVVPNSIFSCREAWRRPTTVQVENSKTRTQADHQELQRLSWAHCLSCVPFAKNNHVKGCHSRRVSYSAKCLTHSTCWTWVGFLASNSVDLFALSNNCPLEGLAAAENWDPGTHLHSHWGTGKEAGAEGYALLSP